MLLKRKYLTLYLLPLFLGIASCGRKEENTKPKPTPDAPSQQLPPTSPPQNGDANVKIFLDGEGVSSKQNKFLAKLEWLSGPKAEDYSKTRLVFSTIEKKRPNSVSGIIFDPQMPSMGHGTATDDQVIRNDGSNSYSFAVDGIYFIMGGRWEVRVTATIDGVTDLVVFPVDVP